MESEGILFVCLILLTCAYRFPSSVCVGIGQVSLAESHLNGARGTDLNSLSALITWQMLATIVVLRVGKLLGVIWFPDMDLSIPRKVRQ